MNRLYFFLVLLHFYHLGFTQGETNVWYFGDKAAIDFNQGFPVNLPPGSMSTPEGSSSISDKNGNLLFYTNGEIIWNRNHQVMQNGDGLDGNNSSTQSSIIVPHPGNDSLYFVFCVDYHAGPKGVTYSLVNIKANNGLGRVVAKNILIAENTTEKISAALHCNKKDVWVTIRLWNSNQFQSFLVSRSGLSVDPVISTTPNILSGHVWGTLGSMKFSPNGNMIAAAHGWGIDYIELGDFNRQTGTITNARRLSVTPPGFSGFITGPYGIEFSPNSRFLYVFCTYGTGKSQIYQFDLSLPTLGDVQNSKQLIAEQDGSFAGSLQLGPDQKIYVSNSNDLSLSVINNPDNAFPLCDFQYGLHKLNRKGELGLPNFVQTFLDPAHAKGEFSVTGCATRNISFQLRTADVLSVNWNFGDPASGINNTSTLFNPSHAYSADGFYEVTLIQRRSCSSDTIRKRIYAGELQLNLAQSSVGCKGDSLLLSVPFYSDLRYVWNTGSHSNSIKTVTPGRYWVTVSAGCTFADTTEVVFQDKPVFDLGSDKVVCTGERVLLDPQITGVTYQWSTGATTPSITVDRIGIYWLTATNPMNCFYRDSILIRDKPFPPVFLGRDTLICETEQLILSPKIGQTGLSYLWQDGSTASSMVVKQAGTYHVKVFDNCTIKRDTIAVSFKTCPMGIPNAFSPNGDRYNQVFRAKYGVNVSKYEMRIYNRYGQLIFHTTDQLKGWDGTFNGRPLPSTTYVWTVSYIEKDTGKPVNLKGTVTLVR